MSELKHVVVARIGKPHGIRGEVTVELFTDSPEHRFIPGTQLLVGREGKAAPRFGQLTIKKSRWHQKILLVAFDEFTDRNTAEALRDYYLFAEPLEASEDEDGWYAEELIGFGVHLASVEGALVGEVANLIIGEHQDLLVVQLNSGKEILVPFVEELVPEIDIERKSVIITPPHGLLEL